MVIENNVFLLVLFSFFLIFAAVQLFYYLYFYKAAVFFKNEELQGKNVPVSVIICARNEAVNLEKHLPSVLEQDYPSYQVIVVNDCSTDKSDDILGRFLLKYPHLKISSISKDPKFTHSKKFAQFIGIKAAANEFLLFTDADCFPVSNKWITRMTSHFDDKTDFVLGYGGYLKTRGLLNRYIRYDSMTIAMQYLGMAINNNPYMGVGRNLAYRRSVFFSNKGFSAHNHLASGDDDLFVNSNATKTNTRVEFNYDSHTRSVPASNFHEWFAQKKRHFTTAGSYKTRDKVLLITEPLSRLLFYSIFITLVSVPFLLPYTLAVFMIRLLTYFIIINAAQKKFNEKGLLSNALFFDLFSPLLNGIVYMSTFRLRRRMASWK
jgi:cellulose synthase/poly-beta-1,6-N-acetylglucosamine synthase-like glycosyltransferase